MKAGPGPEHPFLRWFTHIACKLVLGVGRRPQFLCTWAFPEDCLSVLTTWRLASPRASSPRGQGRSFTVFHGLTSEVTYGPFRVTLLVMQISSGSLCEGTTPGRGYQEARTFGGHLGDLATKQTDRHIVRAK